MAKLMKRIANVSKSVEEFYDVLLAAESDGVDVDEYIYPSGNNNIFYDVANDLGLVVFTGDDSSALIDAIVALGKSKQAARDIAFDLIADFEGGDIEYAERVLNDNGGSTCFVFDPETVTIVEGYDNTHEMVINDAIEKILESRESELLDKLEKRFYKEHPEYIMSIL